MNKSESMTTETGTAGQADALTHKELDAVSGGDPTTTAQMHFLRWFAVHTSLPPPAPDPK